MCCQASRGRSTVAPIFGLVSRGTSVTIHVDLILACTTCHGRLAALYPHPPLVLVTPNRPSLRKRPATYVRMRNKYPWTNCLRTRYPLLVQFDSIPLLSPFVSLLLLFFSVGLYLRPARSTYSLENDRSSVDFTRGGFSRLDSILSLSLSSSLLSCSLMKGRHHLEYRFISFQIVIDFAPLSARIFKNLA